MNSNSYSYAFHPSSLTNSFPVVLVNARNRSNSVPREKKTLILNSIPIYMSTGERTDRRFSFISTMTPDWRASQVSQYPIGTPSIILVRSSCINHNPVTVLGNCIWYAKIPKSGGVFLISLYLRRINVRKVLLEPGRLMTQTWFPWRPIHANHVFDQQSEPFLKIPWQ